MYVILEYTIEYTKWDEERVYHRVYGCTESQEIAEYYRTREFERPDQFTDKPVKTYYRTVEVSVFKDTPTLSS